MDFPSALPHGLPLGLGPGFPLGLNPRASPRARARAASHPCRPRALLRVSPRARVCERIPYRAQRFLCGGSRTLRRPLKTRLGLLERAIKPHFLPKSGRRIFSQTRSREGYRSRTSGCHRQFARAASQPCHPRPPNGFPLGPGLLVSRRPWAAAASQLCSVRAPADFPSRSREGPTVFSLSASPHCPRAFLETGFPPAFMPGPPHPRQRCPRGFPSRSREGYRSRTSGCHRQFARAAAQPSLPVPRQQAVSSRFRA